MRHLNIYYQVLALILLNGQFMASEPSVLSEHLPFINSLGKPAFALNETQDSSVNSKFGGLPNMPTYVAWPEWQGRPQLFVCQIDCSEIPAHPYSDLLPQSGTLSFFINSQQQSQGLDSSEEDSWRVIYDQRSPSELPQIEPPGGVTEDSIFEDDAFVSYEQKFNFSSCLTFPDRDIPAIKSLNLNEAQEDKLIDHIHDAQQGFWNNRMFGYPDPQQYYSMQLECELYKHGIDWDSPEVEEYKESAEDWVLLLQLSTDCGVEWFAHSTVYWWIHLEDLKNQNFNNTRVIFQFT